MNPNPPPPPPSYPQFSRMIYNCVASPRLCCGAQKSETISQKGCSQTACLVTWAYVVLTLSIRDPISPPYPWPPHTPPHTPFPPPPSLAHRFFGCLYILLLVSCYWLDCRRPCPPTPSPCHASLSPRPSLPPSPTLPCLCRSVGQLSRQGFHRSRVSSHLVHGL